MSETPEAQEPERGSGGPDDRADAAKFREYVEGTVRPEDDVRPYEFVGKVPEHAEDVLIKLKKAYEQYGTGRFEDTDWYRRTVPALMSEKAGTALRGDDLVDMQSFVGEPQTTKDVSGIGVLRELRNGIRRPAYTAYVHGHMGDGKTDFALLLAELWEDELQSRNYSTEIGSNVRSFQQGETITEWKAFMDWLEETKDDSGVRKLFVFDEASSHASGYSKQAQEGRRLGKLVNLIRKYQASMIMIGHTGKDLHKDVRRKVIHRIRKRGKKEAVLRTRTDVGGGEGDLSEEMTLTGIPQTSFDYDHMEASDWDWGEDTRAEEALRLKEVYGVPVTTESEDKVSLEGIYEVSDTAIYNWINEVEAEEVL